MKMAFLFEMLFMKGHLNRGEVRVAVTEVKLAAHGM